MSLPMILFTRTHLIYTRVGETTDSQHGTESKVTAAAYKISEQSPVAIPEVKMETRFSSYSRLNVSDSDGTNVFYETFSVANHEPLNVYDFKLIESDRYAALKSPRSVLLTEDMANRIYGESSAAARTFQHKATVCCTQSLWCWEIFLLSQIPHLIFITQQSKSRQGHWDLSPATDIKAYLTYRSRQESDVQ